MKKTFLTLAGLLLCFSIFAQIVPYLQTPTAHSIWVNWRTSAGTESIVSFGENQASLDQTASGSAELFKGVKDGYYGYVYHSVKLEGLQANTTYYYQVKSGTAESAIYSFKTQPELGQSGIYRFMILGDHQLMDGRYERLMAAAKTVAESKYGSPIEQHVNLITNVGDQVNEGTYKQYDVVHFKASELLSPNLPGITIVGNHELNKGEENPLELYNKHFYYNEVAYKGIKSNSKFYYAMQQGRVLFLMLSSEHPGSVQKNWAKAVIDAAKDDNSIDWIISYNHRPLQAEQYVGDISVWVRDEIMPMLNETEKSVMNVSGHHHLYHRGQLRDYPTYHIISGGASWDQRWGQSTEKDFDDVQKTIDYWPFQLVELNSEERSMYVETYVIGNEVETFASPQLVDSFHRIFGKEKPNKPEIAALPDTDIELPYTFESSPYATSTDELYNSVQFQVASDDAFTDLEFDLIRDYENIFGKHSGNLQLVDLHKNVDIFKQTLKKQDLLNGTHYMRVRHRDRNLAWSEWSDIVTFTTIGGNDGIPAITLNKKLFQVNEIIEISYNFVYGESNQWIGIYTQNKKPGAGSNSDEWAYVTGTSGTKTFTIKNPGVYYAVIFRDEGYTILDQTELFYVGKIPVLSAELTQYAPNQTIRFEVSNAPALTNDWVGIYREGQIPGPADLSIDWKSVSGNGEMTFEGLGEGDYFISYFMQDKYFEPGERLHIQVSKDFTGIAGQSSSEPIVFTDWNNHVIHISSPNSHMQERVAVYNAQGILRKSLIFAGQVRIDMQDEAPGVYILQVEDRVTKVIVR